MAWHTQNTLFLFFVIVSLLQASDSQTCSDGVDAIAGKRVCSDDLSSVLRSIPVPQKKKPPVLISSKAK